MAQNDHQVNFRCPAGLKRLLEVAAKGSERTLNAEIVHRLNTSFQAEEQGSVAGSQEDVRRYVKEAITEMIRSGQLKGDIVGD